MAERNYLKTEAVFLAEKTPKKEVVVTPPLREDSLTVTENGTYQAPIGRGYTDVEVNVEGSYYFDLSEYEISSGNSINVTETISYNTFQEILQNNKPIIIQYINNNCCFMSKHDEYITGTGFITILEGWIINKFEDEVIRFGEIPEITHRITISASGDENVYCNYIELETRRTKFITLTEKPDTIPQGYVFTCEYNLTDLSKIARLYDNVTITFESSIYPQYTFVCPMVTGVFAMNNLIIKGVVVDRSLNVLGIIECTGQEDNKTTWELTMYSLTAINNQ